jgi:hypothetical protein
MSVEPAPAGAVPLTRQFPWLRLFRAVGLSFDPKKLFLGALGLVLLHAGWYGLDRAFPDAGLWVTKAVRPIPPARSEGGWRLPVGDDLAEPIVAVIGPFLDVFSPGRDWLVFLHALLAAIWAVAVWGIFGGAIARAAVVQAATGERMGVRAALQFALRKVVPLVVSPLSPLLGVAIAALPCLAIGLLYRIPGEAGPFLAGVLFFIPLVLGLLMTMILVGLAAGWPLMHAAVAAEAQDGFDALSRSYAYVYQRPGRYAAYLALCWLIGLAGFIVVGVVSQSAVSLAEWALSWTGPADQLEIVFHGGARWDSPPPSLIHAFWLGVVGALTRGWIYSYFWSASAMIYLLIRHDVDGTEWYRVALPTPRKHPLWPDSEPVGAAKGPGLLRVD